MTPTTYAPPIRADQLPTTREGWFRRAGLTDPAIIEAVMQRRLNLVSDEPLYADFFHAA